MVERKMSPVLKWAGGKTQLLDPITAKLPQSYNRYYEPFIGGGAVFLAVRPTNAVINDTNEQLVNLYRYLKSDVSTVISVVSELDKIACDKEFYYTIREQYNRKIAGRIFDAECANFMI